MQNGLGWGGRIVGCPPSLFPSRDAPPRELAPTPRPVHSCLPTPQVEAVCLFAQDAARSAQTVLVSTTDESGGSPLPLLTPTSSCCLHLSLAPAGRCQLGGMSCGCA